MRNVTLLCEYKLFSKEAIEIIAVCNPAPVIIRRIKREKGQSGRMDRIALEIHAALEWSSTGHVK
jgi:hypothetical protein